MSPNTTQTPQNPKTSQNTAKCSKTPQNTAKHSRTRQNTSKPNRPNKLLACPLARGCCSRCRWRWRWRRCSGDNGRKGTEGVAPIPICVLRMPLIHGVSEVKVAFIARNLLRGEPIVIHNGDVGTSLHERANHVVRACPSSHVQRGFAFGVVRDGVHVECGWSSAGGARPAAAHQRADGVCVALIHRQVQGREPCQGAGVGAVHMRPCAHEHLNGGQAAVLHRAVQHRAVAA